MANVATTAAQSNASRRTVSTVWIDRQGLLGPVPGDEHRREHDRVQGTRHDVRDAEPDVKHVGRHGAEHADAGNRQPVCPRCVAAHRELRYQGHDEAGQAEEHRGHGMQLVDERVRRRLAGRAALLRAGTRGAGMATSAAPVRPVAVFDLHGTLRRGNTTAEFIRRLILRSPPRTDAFLVSAPALGPSFFVPLARRYAITVLLWITTAGLPLPAARPRHQPARRPLLHHSQRPFLARADYPTQDAGQAISRAPNCRSERRLGRVTYLSSRDG
jgi:hypothetical protein